MGDNSPYKPTPTEKVASAAIEAMVEKITDVADHIGAVVTVHVELVNRKGKRIAVIDAFGKHEIRE